MNALRVTGFSGLQRLAEGELSCLWAATDVETGQRVVLKVATGELAVGLEVFDSYVLRLVASTQHDSLVTVLSGGLTDDGAPMLVLEACEDSGLVSTCDETELALETVLSTMVALSSGVEHLHHQAIVHGALSLEHVVMSPSGQPAIAGYPLPGCAPSGRKAPEVVRGATATERSDVFGLGVMTWELVGSQQLPVSLQTLLASAVVDDPGHRLASVTDFREGLQRVQRQLGQPVTEATRPRGPRVSVSERVEAAANLDDRTQLRPSLLDEATRLRHYDTWEESSAQADDRREAEQRAEDEATRLRLPVMRLPEAPVAQGRGNEAFAPGLPEDADARYRPRLAEPTPSKLPQQPTHAEGGQQPKSRRSLQAPSRFNVKRDALRVLLVGGLAVAVAVTALLALVL